LQGDTAIPVDARAEDQDSWMQTAPTGEMPIGAVTSGPPDRQGQVTKKLNTFVPTGTYTLCDAPSVTVHPAATSVSATV